MVNLWLDFFPLEVFDADDIDFVIEVTDVANDRLVFHAVHVGTRDDVVVARGSHEDVSLVGSLFHGDHFEAFHRGLQCADRIDFSDPNLSAQRGQSLAQMALAWVLRDPRITTALIGASKVIQLENNLAALANLTFAPAELAQIDAMGGAVAAIDYMKSRLVDSNSDRLARIESKETTVVGVNRWTQTTESPLTAGDGAIMVADPQAECDQIERLTAWRASRDEAKVQAALNALRAELPNLRVLAHPRNAGQSRAIRTGVLAERFGADNGRIARIILVSTAVAFLSFSGAVGLMT